MNPLPKLRALLRRRKLEAEMAEEMRAHLELQTAEHEKRGMSADEARYAARREFGGVEQIKERARDQRGWPWLDHLLQDLRYAVRQLRKHPGFTLVAVLSLACGIGVNTANFSLINELFLTSLPAAHPEQLVLFQFTPGPHGSEGRSVYSDFAAAQPLPLPVFERLQAETAILKDVVAIAGLAAANVEIAGQRELVLGQLVSGNYHRALGVSALLGRTLRPEDDQPAAPPVVVISHHYWRERFAGDRGVLGRSMFVNRAPVTIVGVMPAEFAGTILSAGVIDLTLPLGLAPRVRADGPDVLKPEHSWLRVMGRLNAGVTREQARAALEPAFQGAMQTSLGRPDDPPHLRVEAAGQGRTDSERRQQRPFLLVVSGTVGLVLLSACANVANLLLARGAARRREIAVRLALGASRGRIVRQLLTESILLALLGAGAGLFAALWSLELISATLRLDWRVLGFTTVLATLTGLGFGLVPALRCTRLQISAEFQSGSRGLHRARSRLKTALLVLQVTVSCVLLVGAGLFLRTLHNLRTVDAGFNRRHLLLFSVDATSAGYKDRAEFVRLHEGITERLAALPGVRAVGFSAWPLLHNAGGWHRGFSIPGKLKTTGLTVDTVSTDFLGTLEIPLLFGRGFTRQDAAGAPFVIVVNEAFARTYFAGENPVGRSLRLDGHDREIIGVARDAKLQNLRETTRPLAFIPFLQENFGTATFVVRTEGDPAAMTAAVRQTLAEVDPKVLGIDFRTQDESLEHNVLGAERFFTRVSLSLGLLALALACVGLYGLLSYLVTQRTGEIGIRMALGALPGGIVRLILRESLVLVGAGLVLGLAAATVAGRAIAALLYQLPAVDPVTYAVVALALTAVAVLACGLPARRAAKVDPMVALRCE